MMDTNSPAAAAAAAPAVAVAAAAAAAAVAAAGRSCLLSSFVRLGRWVRQAEGHCGRADGCLVSHH